MVDAKEFLSEHIFANNIAPKMVVVGPDAFVVDTGEKGFHDDDEITTFYDRIIAKLAEEHEMRGMVTGDHFHATEEWRLRDGRRITGDSREIFTEIYGPLVEEVRQESLPIIEAISQLPFQYYFNFGFDPLLIESVQSVKPNARIYEIRQSDNRNLWSLEEPSASVDSPWVINLLGRIEAPFANYIELANLLSRILQNNFLHPQIREDLVTAKVLYLGLQMRHWYTKVLLMALRSQKNEGDFIRHAYEIRDHENSNERQTIETYAQSGHKIKTEEIDYRDITKALDAIVERYGISATSIFVSYRHSETCRKNAVVDEILDAHDVAVVSSEKFQNEAGRPWDDIIKDEITQSSIFVILITESLRNDRESYCWKELDIALGLGKDKDKRIIPLVYDGLELPPTAPNISHLQSISVMDSHDSDVASCTCRLDAASQNALMNAIAKIPNFVSDSK
ncbi:MAG: toll/interleukin-1 receptor domain-containing protein [Woeseiaceae bacterium]|nr:toll/interleukin-1 receptor domain-containing protein [Woeseiaceae bacterium]